MRKSIKVNFLWMTPKFSEMERNYQVFLGGKYGRETFFISKKEKKHLLTF